MPDIGLYQAKYGMRRVLDRVPGIARLEPNAVSVVSLGPSVLAGISLAAGWWGLVVVGILARMVLSTLDGLIAERYGKKTRLGAYVNRVPAELGDVVILLGLWTRADPGWGTLVIAGAWLVNVLGVLGLVGGGSTQSVGPAGQTDRLALLLVAAAIAGFVPVDWTVVAQLLVALIALTILLRVRRTVRELGGR